MVASGSLLLHTFKRPMAATAALLPVVLKS
jgi:hypothetical protein